MPEIADVVTLTTISSDWGNDIRDRTIQRYASVAARTAAHPSPTEGDLSYLNDTNRVYVYTGSAWIEQGTSDAGSAWAPVAGGAQDLTSGALTTTLTDKASVVFTKPAAWTTYALSAWGAATATTTASGVPIARVEIGASNGVTNNATPGTGVSYFASVPVFHSVTAQTASPVTVAVAVAELSGDATYFSSTIQFIAYRLT